MSLQEALFYDTVFDALKAIVERAGGNKVIGPRLRPTKGPDAAGKWLADCLNHLRQERLEPDDVLMLLRIGREIGFHGAKHWIDGDTGYAPTEPIEIEEQQAELARVIAGASDQLRRATDALERLQGKGGSKALGR